MEQDVSGTPGGRVVWQTAGMEIRPAALLDGSFRVRRATRDDVGPIVSLLQSDELDASRPSGPAEGALQPYLRAFAAIDADPAHFLAVVVNAGDIVGTLQLTLVPCLAAGAATRLQVEAVHVRADLRSRGLGAAMMEWAVDQGRANGAGMIQLTSNARREGAHRFYRRLGFQPSHIGFKRRVDPASRLTGG